MHEMSIAAYVCDVAGRRAGRHGPEAVRVVGLDVGDHAAVEVHSLSFCLHVCLTTPPFRDARADIRRVPGDALRVTYLEVDDNHSDD